MTTLTSSSSPELAGPNWPRIVALYGVGPLIAVFLVVWLTRSVDAKLNTSISEQRATKALVEKHVEHTHGDLERIARLLYIECKNAAKTTQASNLCEVGR